MTAALNEVNRNRFDDHFFLGRAVVLDGEGGYFVDTLGFPGLGQECEENYLPNCQPAGSG